MSPIPLDHPVSPINTERAVEIATMVQGETMFSPAECRALDRLARGVQGRWVELGSWCGRSFTATALGIQPGSEVIAVDLFTGSFEPESPRSHLAPSPDWVFDHFTAALHLSQHLRPDCEFGFRRTDTVEAADEFEEESVQAIFIDGDHRYEAVRADIAAWLPKIAPGGLIAGHDCWEWHPGVVRAVDECFGGRYQVCHDTRIWHLRK